MLGLGAEEAWQHRRRLLLVGLHPIDEAEIENGQFGRDPDGANLPVRHHAAFSP